jgi:Dolichyl-phosphate-mannose-protein mannosyltransferase
MNQTVRLRIFLLFCFVIASTIIGRSFTALTPHNYDAQLFAYVGSQWLQGYIPYLDIWDHKPPGIFAITAVVFSFFPNSFTALAFVEGIFIVGCVASVYLVLQQWRAPWAVSFLTAVVAAVSSNLFFYNERGHLTEIYLLWPSTLSIYFFIKSFPECSGKWVFLAGFFSGLAALFKPPGLSPLFAQMTFMFLVWASAGLVSFSRFVGAVIIGAVGALVAWLPVCFYFAYYQVLQELIEASFLYNIQYGIASQPAGLRIFSNAISQLYHLNGLLVCAALGLWFLGTRWKLFREALKQREIAPALRFLPLVLLWFLFDLAGALAGGRNYPHYFLALVPSLSVAAGLIYWLVLDGNDDRAFSNVPRVTFFFLIVGPLLFAQLRDVGKLQYSLQQNGKRSRWNEIADYLNTLRGPADTLFTWQYLPPIYYATGIKNAMPLLGGHYIKANPVAAERMGKDIMRRLEETPPTFIIDSSENPEVEKQTNPIYIRFTQILEKRYELLRVKEEFRIYKRNTTH